MAEAEVSEEGEMTNAELDDLIAKREQEEIGNLHPGKFAAFAGRICLLFGFIVGMQMPGAHVWWLTIAAVISMVFFAGRALLSPSPALRSAPMILDMMETVFA